MLRCRLSFVLFSLGACGGDALPEPWTRERIAADLAVARAGCVRCHAEPVDAPGAGGRVPVRGPALADAGAWHGVESAEALLRRHHGGEQAAELAAWVVSQRRVAPRPEPVPTSPARLARGEQLQRELACGACHASSAFAGLAARVDHATLAAFLVDGATHRPGVVHPSLPAAEAAAVAAHLLRAQLVTGAPQPGFAWRAWERRIDDAGLPDLDGIATVRSGIAARIDASQAPREHHYVLRFDATLDVPAAGAWTFTTGSDDSSWLWIDDVLVVANEGLAPHRRRSGQATLTAGPHALRVVFSQAAGGASLEVLWRGPGTAEQELPATRATASADALVAPVLDAPAAAAVARGRDAAQALRCAACHDVADPDLAPLPASTAAPWASLRPGPCPQSPAGAALLATSRDAAQCVPDAGSHLERALLRDGCLSCHVRDGRGGLPPAVQATLATTEDLGDEGRLPPDLTGVGRRLRPEWLRKVLVEGHSVRPYLRVRMPKVAAERAAEYVEWFGRVDGATTAPLLPFDAERVRRGQQLAGTGGRNCITCHGVAGYPSVGVGGMDLAIQHERLQPQWLRSWLLEPTRLRPGTRMPALWWKLDEHAHAEVDALIAWLALGAAAPLPPGLKAAPGSTLLVPGERPLLHGAFLDGVSARCLAVGSSARVHFAYDLATPRLLWLWRGDFLDASGTWNGRAGKLVKPAGGDWRVLDDVVLPSPASRRLLGQRRTPEGWPVLRIAAGDVEYEDEARAVLSAAGGEVVRTLRAVRGELVVTFGKPAPDVAVLVGGAPAAEHRVPAGRALEVVYRW